MRMIEYIPDPFISALAWSIAHSLWQILLIALLWRISLLFARKAPAAIRQNLSIFALLIIPVVFLITFFRQYNIYSKVQRIAFLEFDESPLHPLESAGSWYLLQKESSIISKFLDAYTSQIAWLYIAGVAIISLWFVISYSRVYKLKRHNINPLPDKWAEAIRSARSKTRIPEKVKIWLSPGVSVPVVVGFFKPVVLFPLAVSSSLTIEEVENILLHELYHIRCKDHYINAFQYILEILFFYHPATWWISQTLRSQRENKVDEWVVRETNNPLKYAQTLISLEEKRNLNTQTALAATSSSSSLFYRIKNIMTMKTRKFKSGQKFAAMLVIAVAAISLAWINPAAVLRYNAPDDTNIFETDPQPLTLAQAETKAEQRIPTPPDKEPSRIVLENGNSVAWSELSEEDREEVRQAIREAQIAVREAMEEVRAEFQSEEFKKEMQEAREEVRKAMAEINNEEFRAEMRQARDEVKNAIKEVGAVLSDEEFQNEMRQVSVELRKAFKEMEKFDWSEMGRELNSIMEEVGKSMEVIGPVIQEALREIDFEKIMKEVETQEEKEQ
ncbi:MAG: hypothetical protein EA361_11640 [Bacteroidetes bacterium]|nr:MAG: hypothetical protein EA361_11640 [Bacteroidota bacterium]